MIKITSHKNTNDYFLIEASALTSSLAVFERIAEICNEDLVYKTLFEEMLNDERYSLEKAESFIGWVKSAWDSGEFYSFFIIDQEGLPVGTLGPKDNSSTAEIGYWLSAKHSGLMTDALKHVLSWMKDKGFKGAFADVLEVNVRSAKVVERNGLVYDCDIELKGKEYRRYKIVF